MPSLSLKIADPATNIIGSLGNRQRSSCRVDPSIHLEAALGLGSIDHLPRTSYLRKGCVEEVLMPESRVHRHHQHLVEVLQDFFENGRGGCRIYGDADPFAQFLYALHGARQIVVALPMNQK